MIFPPDDNNKYSFKMLSVKIYKNKYKVKYAYKCRKMSIYIIIFIYF